MIDINTGKEEEERWVRISWGQSWKVCRWVEGVSVDSVAMPCWRLTDDSIEEVIP